MPMNPACQSLLASLSPYIDGELAPPERQVVERHLSACPDCTMRVADLRAESGLIRIGLEFAADDVDFRDFAQNVMARITPERPPVLERVKMWFSETLLYQRGTMITAMATAAIVLAVAVPVALQTRTPVGYAGERMMVEGVRADPGAQVAPVVYETETGDAIIWMLDAPPPAPETDTQSGAVDANGNPVMGPAREGQSPAQSPDTGSGNSEPNGGTL